MLLLVVSDGVVSTPVADVISGIVDMERNGKFTSIRWSTATNKMRFARAPTL